MTRYGRIRPAGTEASRALQIEERFPPELPPDLNRRPRGRRRRLAYRLARMLEAARFLASREQTMQSGLEGDSPAPPSERLDS